MKCSNCAADALYVLDNERVSTIYYCAKCLPPFLRTAASKGQLTIKTEPIPTPPKKKSSPAPVIEEVVEEPVLVDEPLIEAPDLEDAPVEEGSESTEA